MKYKFLNRYNDTLIIIKDDKRVIIEGFIYYRTLHNVETNIIECVDPSGGPFISIGDDLIYLNENLKGVLVDTIHMEDNKIVLNTK